MRRPTCLGPEPPPVLGLARNWPSLYNWMMHNRPGGSFNWLDALIRRAPRIVEKDTWPASLSMLDMATTAGFVSPTEPLTRTYDSVVNDTFTRPRRNRLRLAVFRTPWLAALLFHKNSFVAPEAYPERIQAIFPTTPTPAPYEVAGWLYRLTNGLPPATTQEAIETRLVAGCWHMGFPLEAMDTHLALATPAIERLEAMLKLLLNQPTFFLWALGDDLIPTATTPTRLKLLYNTILAENGMATGRARLERLRNSAYVKAIEARGAPLRPIRRARYARVPVFPDYQAKLLRLSSSPHGILLHTKLKRQFAKRQYEQNILSWADFSLSPEEDDALQAYLATRTRKASRRTTYVARSWASPDAG